jgi:hypothetical protein
VKVRALPLQLFNQAFVTNTEAFLFLETLFEIKKA